MSDGLGMERGYVHDIQSAKNVHVHYKFIIHNS